MTAQKEEKMKSLIRKISITFETVPTKKLLSFLFIFGNSLTIWAYSFKFPSVVGREVIKHLKQFSKSVVKHIMWDLSFPNIHEHEEKGLSLIQLQYP